MHARNRARALQTPGDDLKAQLIRLLGVVAGDNLAVLAGDEVRQGRGDNLDAVGVVLGEVGDGGVHAVKVGNLVEVHGLLGELWLVLEPVEQVVVEEALGPDAAGGDAGLLEGVDELLGVLLLGVVALEGHGHLGGLELRGELQAEGLCHGDVLLERERGAAGVVEVGAPAGDAAQVVGGRGGAGVEGVHLGAQRLELGEGEVAGAALGRGGLAVGGGLEGRGALAVELGDVDDVGGGVQVALAVAAHQLQVLGEGDVALEHAGAHASARQVGLARVLGELQGAAAAVRDGEGRRLHLELLARVQLGLEGAVRHAVD